MQNNLLDKKRKIIDIIKRRGPSLPVHIANETGLSMLFSSAFLSELLGDKEIAISKLKVGGSPLYYFQGQESQLENFIKHIEPKEQEAFEKLKQKQILEDEKQEPAIRVALRNIKDFSYPIEINKKLYWRFYSINEQKAKEKLKQEIKPFIEKELPTPPQETPKQIPIQIEQTTKPNIGESIIKEIPRIQITSEKNIEQKSLIGTKPQSQKIESKKQEKEFVKNIIEFLQKEDIELLEEYKIHKKEYQGKIRINSDLGKIEFLLIAKDKKKVTENDFAVAIQNSNTQKLPIFFISPGEIAKKAQTFLDEWKNFLKFKKI